MSQQDSPNELSNYLPSVNSIITKGLQFHVAEYQRGYKWTQSHIHNLLDDLLEFANTSSQCDGYYCLQPLVVCQSNDKNKYELIDGQQRLTSIYLILSYLGESKYEIEYRTRASSKEFLIRLGDRQLAATQSWDALVKHDPTINNVDNYHLFHAAKYITEWFHNKDDTHKLKLTKTLLHKTRFIWHEVLDTEPEIAFLNLNSGKISLTPAELIKALFLRTDPSSDIDLQRERAREWDQIEISLQQPEFWFFLNPNANKSNLVTRIEFIFDIIAGKNCEDKIWASYLYYADKVREGRFHISSEWQKVKRIHQKFTEWYEHVETYHSVGYLLHTKDKNIQHILDLSEKHTKSEFKKQVSLRIKKSFENIRLADLNYNKHYSKINNILLLFNLESFSATAQKLRFSFYQYSSTAWSLEHVHAQNSDTDLTDKSWTNWVNSTLAILRNLEKTANHESPNAPINHLSNRLKNSLPTLADTGSLDNESSSNLEARELLVEDIKKFIEPDIDHESMHGIANMALLAQNLNSSLGCKFFAAKRDLIRDWDIQGKFIPIATKNLFMKYYTDDVTDMFRWTKQDQEDYLNKITQTLKNYLPSQASS